MDIGTLLLRQISWWVPLLLSLAVHEWAHARAAALLGDQTAARQGRDTLDPLAHIDLLGTVMLPLLGVPFGWARPVPVNPSRFTQSISMRLGMVWVALAGPLSNLVLAVLALGAHAMLFGHGHRFTDAMSNLTAHLVMLNGLLAVFNLLPIHPLDGSRVVDGLLPDRLSGPWLAFKGAGIIPLGALLLLTELTGYSLFRPVLELTATVISSVEG